MKRRHAQGFTLIELLIAMAILIIGVVGVLLVIPAAQRTSGQASQLSRAAMVASQAFEELKVKGYDALSAQAVWTGNKDEYTWEAQIVPVTSDDYTSAIALPTERFVKISMTVSYAVRGKQRQEQFTTLFGEV